MFMQFSVFLVVHIFTLTLRKTGGYVTDVSE